MANRTVHRRSTSRRPAVAILLAFTAGVFGLLATNGALYRMTDGDLSGMYLTIAAVWLTGISGFAALWAIADPRSRYGKSKAEDESDQGSNVTGLSEERARRRTAATPETRAAA